MKITRANRLAYVGKQCPVPVEHSHKQESGMSLAILNSYT